MQQFTQPILKLAVRDDVRFGDEKRVAAQFAAALHNSLDAVGEVVKMDVRLPTIRFTRKEVAFATQSSPARVRVASRPAMFDPRD